MATEAQVNQLRQLADIVTKTPIDQVVANAEWGKINFEGARKSLQTINSIATGLKTLPVERLPGDDITFLINPLGAVATQLDLMSKFSIELPNAISQRDNIVNALNVQANELYAQSQARVPFLAFQRADVRENEERFAQAVRDARDLLDAAKGKSERASKEISDIITAAREASAGVGVAHYTADFDNTAAALDTAAKHWLVVTAIFAAATVAAALVFPFIFKIEDGHQLQAVQIFTSKLVAIGTFLTATIWCGRLFKAPNIRPL